MVTMGPSTGVSNLSRISLLALLSITPVIQAIPMNPLFTRQDEVCGGNSELSQCGDDFPSDFCCPSNSECQRLASPADVTSVICGEKGKDYTFITPTTCDIRQFDPKTHPANQLHLSTNDIELPTCGDKCCPVGYQCTADKQLCQALPQTSSTASPSASATATSTSPPYLISTPSPTGESPSETSTTAEPATQEPKGSGFDGKAFAAGFLPGIVLGILACLGLWFFLKKRREAKKASPGSRFSGDFGHVSRNISDPIYDPVNSARTDFIRRHSRAGSAPSLNHSNSPPFHTVDDRRTTYNPAENDPVMQSSMRAAAGISSGPIGGNSGGASGLTPRIRSLWERTPKLGFGPSGAGFVGLPSNPAPQRSMTQTHPQPPPPLIRAGSNNGRDPYKTPSQRGTPARTASWTRSHRTTSSASAVPLKVTLTPQRPSPQRLPPIQTATPLSVQQTPPHHRGPQQQEMSQVPLEQGQRPAMPGRGGSQETIDVLMRPPSFLAPPKAPGMREPGRDRRDTQDTTFTKLMERAGYEGEEREEVRGWAKVTPKR